VVIVVVVVVVELVKFCLLIYSLYTFKSTFCDLETKCSFIGLLGTAAGLLVANHGTSGFDFA